MRFELIRNFERLKFILQQKHDVMHICCFINKNVNILTFSLSSSDEKSKLENIHFHGHGLCTYIIKYNKKHTSIIVDEDNIEPDQDKLFFNNVLHLLLIHLYYRNIVVNFLSSDILSTFSSLCKQYQVHQLLSNLNICITYNKYIELLTEEKQYNNKCEQQFVYKIINNINISKAIITNLFCAWKIFLLKLESTEISELIKQRFGPNLWLQNTPYVYTCRQNIYVKNNMLLANVAHLSKLCYLYVIIMNDKNKHPQIHA